MKRVVVLLLALLVVFALSANNQDYYAVSSVEWQTVNKLCHYAGIVGPTSNGPVTKAQLLSAIERAEDEVGERDSFLLYAKSIFVDEEPTITDGVGSVTLSLDGSLEGYLTLGDLGEMTYIDGYMVQIDKDSYLAKARDRKPLFNVGAEFNLKDNAYGRFNFNFVRDMFKEGIWNERFSSNVSKIRTENFPYDSGISIGNDNLNLMIARARASLGEGRTGNTAIGDNYDYQEFMKGSIFSDYMGIYLRITQFDSSHDSTFNTNPYALVSPRFSGYKQLRHEMGFEFLPLKNFRFSLYVINLIDTTSSIDIRMLNPFTVLHNMFNYVEYTDSTNWILEGNNMLFVDLSFSPIRGLNLYGQFTMDQMQSKGEVDTYKKLPWGVDPNAFGLLFNVSYTGYIKDGVFDVYLEGVYNTPGLYLNSKFYKSASDNTVTNNNTGLYCWSQDWLVGYSRAGYTYGDVSYSGYQYGPDCIVLSIGSEYRKRDYTISSSLFYMAHGEKGRGTKLSNYTFEGLNTVDTYKTKAPSGIVEHTALVSLVGEYRISSLFSFSLGGAYSYVWNYLNEEGRNKSSLEVVFGLTVTWDIPTILDRTKK